MRWLKAVAVLLVLRVVGCTACAASDDAEDRYAYVLAQLRSESPGTGVLSGEWYLVSLSMAGLAAENLGHHADLAWLTRRALEPDVRRFDTKLWRSDALETLATDEGHVGYLGHLGLLLALDCSDARAADRHRVLSALERRYAAAPDGLIATYPNQKWIPDNAVSLAAVAIGARCDGRDVPAREWLQRWPRDAPTGLLQFVPGRGPRASGAGWNGIYLPYVDAAFARAQFDAAQKTFGFSLLGLEAWREFPSGVEGHGDVDSGPLVFGLSPAGTGFAIASASRWAPATRAGMLRTAEVAGMTVGSHYVVAPLVGEAAVLAAKTMRP